MSATHELYHWEPNGVFLKPLIALEEKKAQFTSHWFDPTRFEQLAPGFPASIESSLQLEREGPILVADGKVISSTFFMLEYIAEAIPGPSLLPETSYDRYRARAWGQYLGLQLGPSTSALGCARFLAPELAQRDQAALRREIERIEPVERRNAWLAVIDGAYDDIAVAAFRERVQPPIQRVEATLSRSPWLAGHEYSIADIDAYALVDPLRELSPAIVSPKGTPRVIDWLERITARPAVQSALSRARREDPRTAFVPGVEPSRWG